jgi:hypothetical protein
VVKDLATALREHRPKSDFMNQVRELIETATIVRTPPHQPVRTDVTPQPGIARLGETKGITCTPDELNANVPGLIDRWRDTFGV